MLKLVVKSLCKEAINKFKINEDVYFPPIILTAKPGPTQKLAAKLDKRKENKQSNKMKVFKS